MQLPFTGDCNMPVMDGWEATQEIQKVLGHNLPIIAVTANALKGDREKCLDAGMDDYITKPVKLSLLLDVLVKWIDLSCARRTVEEGKNAIPNDTGDGEDPGGDVLRLSSFSIYGSSDTSQERDVRKRMLTMAPPSRQPVDMVGQ
jgi:hypothetical protein